MESERHFYCIPGLAGSQNLVNLIKSFAILTGGDSAVDAQLVITGNEDPYYPEVKRTVKELGVEHAVIFPEWLVSQN